MCCRINRAGRARLVLVALALATVLASCRFVQDLLHMDPVEVVDHTPNSTAVEADTVSEVSVTFSSQMDQTRTEDAFSLEEDTSSLAGSFSWQDDDATLAFAPTAGIRPGKTYTISVSTGAQDRWGNSLAREFAFSFRTGTETEPPTLTHDPADGDTVALLDYPITITFSEEVERASFLAGFSIAPQVDGWFEWSTAGNASIVTYRPLTLYEAGTSYTVTVDESVADVSGNPLGTRTAFVFTAGSAVALATQSVTAVSVLSTIVPP